MLVQKVLQLSQKILINYYKKLKAKVFLDLIPTLMIYRTNYYEKKN